MYIYIYIYIHIHVYIYIERERKTYIQYVAEPEEPELHRPVGLEFK